MAMGLGDAGTRSEINITPYIDVLLVLLIIFILGMQRFTIPVQVARQGAEDGKESNTIFLELTNEGGYRVNTVPIPRDSLLPRLREIFAPRPEKVLFVRSGRQRLYKEMLEAVDVAKSAGVQVVALAP